MASIDLRVEQGAVAGLEGSDLLQALQEPFYTEWKNRGSTEEAGGALLSGVTPGQRRLLTTWWVDGEVGGGGVAAVFYNSTGSYLPEILESLDAIGARARAEILRRAAALLFPGGEVPRSTEARNELMDGLPEEDPELDERLEELDEAWYEQEDQLEDLLLQLVHDRTEDFLR